MNNLDLGPWYQTAGTRLYFLDWLRVFATFSLFFFHVAYFIIDRSFNLNVRLDDSRFGLTAFLIFVHMWIMPLFFFIAGASAWYSVSQSGGGLAFVLGKFRRLIIPYLFGVFALLPFRSYFDGLLHGKLQKSFFAYYSSYFQHFAFDCKPEIFGTFGFYLWFLPFLFLYSFSAPLLLAFFKGEGKKLLSNVDERYLRYKVFLYLILPTLILQAFMRVRFPAYEGWSDFLYWFFFFFIGFCFTSRKNIAYHMTRQQLNGLVLGVVSFVGILYLLSMGDFELLLFSPKYNWKSLFFFLLSSINVWAWILVFLGFAARHMNFANGLLIRLNEGLLPFYILHYSVITIVGIYSVRLISSLTGQFIFIAIVALMLTVGLYILFVKRFKVMRFFFGMR